MQYIGSVGSKAETATSPTCVITVGIAVPKGSKVCVAAVHNASALPTGIADSRGNTYTLDKTASPSGAPVTQTTVGASTLSVALQVGDTITVTWATGQSRLCAVADAFSPAGALDVSAEATGSSTAPSAGSSGTLGHADEVVYVAHGVGASTVPTMTGGFSAASSVATARGSNERAVAAGYQFTTATTAVTGSATLSASASWCSAMVSYPMTPQWSEWNGTTEAPLTVDGEWNGTAIGALSFDFVT